MTIEDEEGCPRYIGRLFRDVRIGASPPWLKARLTAAGMRPISNVVDVTNYVMLALGNPLHAFDFDTLRGGGSSCGAPGEEEFTSLDGNLRRLDPADLVIADGEGAIAFAGIMGGLDTEVTESTTSVLLEAANFEPEPSSGAPSATLFAPRARIAGRRASTPTSRPRPRASRRSSSSTSRGPLDGRYRWEGDLPGVAHGLLPDRPGEQDHRDRHRGAGAEGHPRAAGLRRRSRLGRASRRGACAT